VLQLLSGKRNILFAVGGIDDGEEAIAAGLRELKKKLASTTLARLI